MRQSAYTLLLTLIFLASTAPLVSNSQDDDRTMYVYSPTGIYLREDCGQKSKKIMLLPYMTKVQYNNSCGTESEIINGVAGYWVSVTTADEKEGYVFSGYLSNKKKKLEKNDIVSEKKMDKIKKDISEFVTGQSKKIDKKVLEMRPIYITLVRFNESNYKKEEVDESGIKSITDYKKLKKEFDQSKTCENKNNCSNIEIKGRKFVLLRFNEECCASANFIIYQTFINNVLVVLEYEKSYFEIGRLPIDDIFVRDNNSIHNLLNTMKGKEYINFFEELVSEVAETVAAAK